MKDMWFFLFPAAVFVAQLLLCRFAKRRRIRWLPTILLLLLMLLCFGLYACSNWTNWAFLILMLLLGIALAADSIGWLIGSLWRCVEKRSEKK